MVLSATDMVIVSRLFVLVGRARKYILLVFFSSLIHIPYILPFKVYNGMFF